MLTFVKIYMTKIYMVLRDFGYKHPLVFLQIGGWFTYIFIDIIGHVSSGYFLYAQSISYGTVGLLLTSCVALLSNKNKSPNTIFQSLYFLFLLYIATIIWHKIFKVIHFQEDVALSIKISQLFDQSLLKWLQVGYMPVSLFLAWGGIYISTKWYLTLQAKQSVLDRALLDKKQAQLEILRYQLNPHFLFNVLNSIDVSVLNNDKNTAHNMLKHLSSFLRNTLQEGENDRVTLEKEFDVIQNFISIEQLRFGDALELQINLEDSCRNALIPPMLLQPLVENAIKYGWSQKMKGHVNIFALKQNKMLKIVIRNNKVIEEVKTGTGTGLKNTQQRLKLIYGDDGSIVTHDHDYYFEVEVNIPWEEQL